MKMNSPNLQKKVSVNANDPYLGELLEAIILALICEFNYYQNYSRRKSDVYQVWDYGEVTLVSTLTHALRRIDSEYKRLIFMQEVGLEDESHSAQGRADLIIQDLENDVAIIVEAKKHFSNPYAPVKHWNREASEKYYCRVMDQCKAYYEAEKFKLLAFKTIYSLTVGFDSVHFRGDKESFNNWTEYKRRFNNEYYYFFSDTDEKYGLAIYGTYENYQVVNPK